LQRRRGAYRCCALLPYRSSRCFLARDEFILTSLSEINTIFCVKRCGSSSNSHEKKELSFSLQRLYCRECKQRLGVAGPRVAHDAVAKGQGVCVAQFSKENTAIIQKYGSRMVTTARKHGPALRRDFAPLPRYYFKWRTGISNEPEVQDRPAVTLHHCLVTISNGGLE